MWEKRRSFTTPVGVLPEPVSQWTIPEKSKTVVWGLRTYFFKTTLEALGFCFRAENSKQTKPSPLETPQKCVTHPLHKF